MVRAASEMVSGTVVAIEYFAPLSVTGALNDNTSSVSLFTARIIMLTGAVPFSMLISWPGATP
ncbi:hypothetical protein Q7W74_07185 [Morganella morganii]